MSVLALGGAPAALPHLRGDLRMLRGPRDDSGAPTWTLHDPAANRFFRVGWREGVLIAHWRPGDTPAGLVRRVNAVRPVRATEDDVDRLLRFLAGNQLVAATTKDARAALVDRARKGEKSASSKLLHNYLFFRLPLMRPDRLLDAVGPLFRFAFQRWFWTLVALVGGFGVLLVMRRWDEFLTTFSEAATPRGMALYMAALAVTKLIHEFAHALACWRHGVRVPTVGIAFMVLWPVLYTDATGAWALNSRRARLQIAGAGIMAELALSALATVAWVFLPEGPVRGAVFFVATTSWILTLAVNLNPFMRFDGYYLMSDAIDVPNLQERSFALGRWLLRKVALGLDDPPPEDLPARRRALLIAYAYGVWIYRFLLFIGIALLVYHFVVKIVGIFLMAVEIVWFILRPIATELGIWWERRGELRANPRLVLFLVLVFVGLPVAATTPLPVGLTAPAAWRADSRVGIFGPLDARVSAVHVARGDLVRSGDVLVTLESPDLDSRIAQAEREVEALRGQTNALATDRLLRGQLELARRQFERARSRLAGYLEERRRLEVRAPVDGRLVELDPHLAPGRWVGAGSPLGTVADTSRAVVEAYVPESMLLRLSTGVEARFDPYDPDRPSTEVIVRSIDDSPAVRLDTPLLASIYGGDVPARETPSGGLEPDGAYYRVRLEPVARMEAPVEVAGRVTFRAEPESIATRVWRATVATFVRESGF